MFDPNLVSPKKAADHFHVSYEWVTEHIRAGHIAAQRIGKRNLITSLDAVEKAIEIYGPKYHKRAEAGIYLYVFVPEKYLQKVSALQAKEATTVTYKNQWAVDVLSHFLDTLDKYQ